MPGREGRGRLRIGGKKRLGRWCIKLWLMFHPTKWQTNMDGHESPPPLKLTPSHCIRDWCSLLYGQPSYMGQVYQPHLMQDHLCRRWKKRTPQEESDKVDTWWPTSKASLGWKNRKLWLLPWTSAGASTEDGWRPQVIWFGCRLWKEHICKAEGMTSIPVDAGR